MHSPTAIFIRYLLCNLVSKSESKSSVAFMFSLTKLKLFWIVHLCTFINTYLCDFRRNARAAKMYNRCPWSGHILTTVGPHKMWFIPSNILTMAKASFSDFVQFSCVCDNCPTKNAEDWCFWSSTAVSVFAFPISVTVPAQNRLKHQWIRKSRDHPLSVLIVQHSAKFHWVGWRLLHALHPGMFVECDFL